LKLQFWMSKLNRHFREWYNLYITALIQTQFNPNMSYTKQVIYPPEVIHKDLSSALETHAKLPEEDRKKNPRWYDKHVKFGWDKPPFNGPKDTKFFNIVTTFGGKTGSPLVRFIGETIGNSIAPTDEKEIAELKRKNPNSKYIVEKRDMPPDIRIKKWNTKIETEEKNPFEFKKGSDGKPMIPDDKTQSKLFAAMELYFKAIADELEIMKESKKLVSDVSKLGEDVLHNDNISTIIPIKTVIKKGPHRGKMRLNPFFQIKVVFNKDNPSKSTQFLDKRKKFTKDGKQDFEHAKLEDGSSINNDNIHKWITFGVVADGLVPIGSMCFSNMGISGQAKGKMIISQPAERKVLGASSIYDGDDDEELAGDNNEEDEEPTPRNKDSPKASGDDNKKQDTGNVYQQNLTLMKKDNKKE
jgi:hypothetical protein